MNKEFNNIQGSLRSNVRRYLKRASQIEDLLAKRPDDWVKFQDEFTKELDQLFKTVRQFEKEKIACGEDHKVKRLKRFFVQNFREYFKRGEYCRWTIEKPYGYDGDFRIIDAIYANEPVTSGFDRLFDNYFQQSAISEAVRIRKECFKGLISDFIDRQKGRIRIMVLASGPCREVVELVEDNRIRDNDIFFDCYDHDTRALKFAEKVLPKSENIRFVCKNALRMAASKDISKEIGCQYDMIYSTGLFDYLSDRVAISLIGKLRTLLTEQGELLISNVRDKYSNPSAHAMEWIGEWILIYRTQEEFKNLFLEAGFKQKELLMERTKDNIMQYIKAVKA